MLVYIADDEWTARNFLAEALRKDGHEVIEFDSGEQLLEQYNAMKSDVVITDRRMFKVSGDDVCRAVKGSKNRTKTILASVVMPPSPVRDADYMVEKNGSLAKFINSVRNCLGGRLIPS